MNDIRFRAGYYEWNVFIGENWIYSFNDVSEDITEDMHIQELGYLVDDLINHMQEELEDEGKEQLEEKYILELKRQMIEMWSYHYDIEE